MKRKILGVVVLVISGVLAISTNANIADKNSPKAILITPPAPKFADAKRQAELAKRRAEFAAKIGKNSMAIFFSTEPRIYSNDVDFMYRQENNLFYLTHLKQQNATLAVVPNNPEFSEILFLPKRDPRNEAWNGKMYSIEDARRISGIKEVWEADEFQPFAEAFKSGKSYTAKNGKVFSGNALSATAPTTLYLLLPTDGDLRELRREKQFAEDLQKEMSSGFKIENSQYFFDDMRLVKSPYEMKIMQHAIDITTEAQMRAMATVGRAKFEYEVQAEVEYTFRRRNADYWGYPSIVGCGGNATTLHYVESQGEVNKGDLLLLDVGAEYEHYTADVTRTFPVNGKFTKEQAEIYQIVYDAQEAVAKATKPGATFFDVNKAADEVIKDGLFKLGLTTDKNSRQHKIWALHSTSHWLGMNVHDAGAYNSKFKPGFVFTNEPGVYIRADALDNLPKTPENEAFIKAVKPIYEKYKNIGVRIEDDLIVTETGCDWMTKKLPRTVADIEAFMAKAEKELPMSELQKEKFAPKSVFFDANANLLTQKLPFDFSTAQASGKTVKQGFVKDWKRRELLMQIAG